MLDLRSLVPLDRDALYAVARHCGRVLIVHEDSRTGGIGESLAALIHPRPTLILTGNRLAATPSDPVVFVAAVVPLIQAMATVPVEAE